MSTALIILALALTAITALALPWVGVVASYFMAIFSPQTVWFWHFEDLRPVYWVLIPTVIGGAIAALRGHVRLAPLMNVRGACLLVLWLCALCSLFFGPFAIRNSDLGLRDANFVFETQSKILLLFLIGGALLVREVHLKALVVVVVFSCLYLTYWANDIFLEVRFIRRLPGPTAPGGTGPYADENNFAAFFAATMPFLWYMSFYVRSRLLRLMLWLAIPFVWHALFLTASRGGLLSLAVVLAYIGLRSKQRFLGLSMIPAFVLAFVYQGGDEMKERAASLDDYAEDDSAASRLDAWAVALRMMNAYPFTGVGPGAFVRAFPHFAERNALQAHNTFFQIGAEYGPVAAIALLVSVLSCLAGLWAGNSRLLRLDKSESTRFLYLAGEATIAGLLGMLVSSLFLTFQLFELFYFMIFLANLIIYCTMLRCASLTVAQAVGAPSGGTRQHPAELARSLPLTAGVRWKGRDSSR